MKPQEKLQSILAADMDNVNTLIRERMASENAPRIPEVTAHLIDAGGKRLRPMMTLASAAILRSAMLRLSIQNPQSG